MSVLDGYPYYCVSYPEGAVLVHTDRNKKWTMEERAEFAKIVERLLNEEACKILNELNAKNP